MLKHSYLEAWSNLTICFFSAEIPTIIKDSFFFRCPDANKPENINYDFDTCVGEGKVEDYGTPYDFYSIMHYSPNA